MPEVDLRYVEMPHYAVRYISKWWGISGGLQGGQSSLHDICASSILFCQRFFGCRSGAIVSGETVDVVLLNLPCDIRADTAALLEADRICFTSVEDTTFNPVTIENLQPRVVLADASEHGARCFDMIRHLTTTSDISVILIANTITEDERIEGFLAGADDFIVESLSAKILHARILIRLHRSVKAWSRLESVTFALDETAAEICVNGQPLKLTRREYQILSALVQRKGQIVSRNQLIDLSAGSQSAIYDRTIDSHVKNIRTKIKTICPNADPITTEYGLGYKLIT